MIAYVKRQNKYGSRWTEYNGQKYQSKREAEYAAELDLRLYAKDIKSWRRQIPIDLEVYGKKICRYYMDFEITHNDDSLEMVEVKGFETEVWRLKWKLISAIYGKEFPEIKLTIVK